jgi:hypothetical protein
VWARDVTATAAEEPRCPRVVATSGFPNRTVWVTPGPVRGVDGVVRYRSTPGAVTSARLLFRAKRGSLRETAPWATNQELACGVEAFGFEPIVSCGPASTR